MGKPTICLGENKGADQLRGNREADQRLCFCYLDSIIPPLLQNFKLLACFCDCTGRFVSDLFGNHIVGFPTRRLKCVVVFYHICHTMKMYRPAVDIIVPLFCLTMTNPKMIWILYIEIKYKSLILWKQ